LPLFRDADWFSRLFRVARVTVSAVIVLDSSQMSGYRNCDLYIVLCRK